MPAPANHYAVLGLDRRCSAEQVREAYRILAKRHHPDLNAGSADAVARTQELNAAYETLSDPALRQAYDDSLAALKPKPTTRAPKASQNIAEDVQLRIEEFFRGATLEVRVNDPGNPDGPETYPLEIPPETAPGARFRIRREGRFNGGHVLVRVRARPDFRFKVRGSDLRCDLKIQAKRAAQGGSELVPGPTGNRLRVTIPAGIARGEEIRLEGEGLPKARGGRGDLLVRVMYRPDFTINRKRGG
jgi:DnaJ-class molecular chaperone